MGAVPQMPLGLATVPGDLPVCSAGEAVEMATRGRELPTVPVLAASGCSLLHQAVDCLAGVRVLPSGALQVDLADFGVQLDRASDVSGPAHVALSEMLARWPALVAATPTTVGVRLDLLGPVTLALFLYSAGVPQAQALDAARVVCSLRAEAMLRAVRAVEPERPVALVMSEPRLVGSMHPTFPLSVRQVRAQLDPVVDIVDRAASGAPVLIGVHVPGRSDWPTIISSGVSFLSMPPDPALVGWSDFVQAMLDNGGFIAWGALPVDRPLGSHEELLWRHLSATWSDLVAAGVDPALLRRRCLVSPSGGLGCYGPEQVAGVLALLDALAARVRRQAIGTRGAAGS
jgi:hypothetical protein